MGYFSNGTEGAMFEEAWCARCVHSDIGPGKEIGVDPPCPIWFAHMLYAYKLCNEKEHPAKVILDALIPQKMVTASDGHGVGVNECAMFHSCDSATPGQTTLEVEA